MVALTSKRAQPLSGDIAVPGDKSISHRALMIAGVSVGESHIKGLLESDDVMRTASAMGELGAVVERLEDGRWRVAGRGVGGLAEPSTVLDMGNSGTSARLLVGLLAAHPFTSFLTGDDSLRRRPMNRVMEPLRRMGATFLAATGDRLPLAVTGAAMPIPITFELPVASAQVKSAVLLAGLNTPGVTTVVEPRPSRDHSELMLRHFGADVVIEAIEGDGDGAGRVIALRGQPELAARDVDVPGDLSSAAFPLVAALLVPGSDIVLRRVGVNPLRAGLLETLVEMGADITVTELPAAGGEAVADIAVRASDLRGVEVPPQRVPAMIDEYPVLAVAAAAAGGTTTMIGLGELRHKESDRLEAIARGLAACGVKVEAEGDNLAVHGTGGGIAGGAGIDTGLDHRMAMAFLVLGTVSREPVRIDDDSSIATSFPGFVELMNRLGAGIEEQAA